MPKAVASDPTQAMIELGNYNTLTVKRSTRFGLFLGDDDVDDLLLPAKYVPETLKIGDSVRVFCYLDHEERPVATTLDPLVTRNRFAALEVAEVNQFGAFMDWGLEKHLLVPFREQPARMEKGLRYVVYCYLDPKSFRLVGSARLDRFFEADTSALKPGQEVELLFYRATDLGWEAVVDQRYKGLVFHDQIFREVQAGTVLTGYVKSRRADGKLDLVLEPPGSGRLEPAAARIYRALEEAGGWLPLHDKSDPEAIRAHLGMSKKLFKNGVGILYRERRIILKEDGIYLADSPGAGAGATARPKGF